MEVKDIFWFEHSSKIGNVSSAKIKGLLQWDDENDMKEKYEDYNIHLNEDQLEEYKGHGLKVERLEGI